MPIELRVNGSTHVIRSDARTPLLYVLRNELGLRAAKFGCGLEQCGACAVLVGGESVLSCGLAVADVGQREIVTVEGLASQATASPSYARGTAPEALSAHDGQDGRAAGSSEAPDVPAALHPIQRAFLDENAAQCAYCIPGILIATAALLAWNEAPDREAIRRALAPHLCRCGAHPRILRAVERAARALRSCDEPTPAP